MYIYERDLVFIDTETTGLEWDYHEIIEIGAIRTTPAGVPKVSFERKLKPVFIERMTSEAQKVNGYDPEMWKTANHSSGQLWNEFNDFVKDAVPFCHNVSFDRPFIEKATRNAGIKRLSCDYHWIGTESLAWPLCQQKLITKFSLSSLCEYFGIEPEPLPHRALNGATKCLEVYRKIIRDIRVFGKSHDVEKYFIDPVTGPI